MGCFWSHDWNQWDKPFEVQMMKVCNGVKIGSGVDHMQRRTCSKCGMVEERTL